MVPDISTPTNRAPIGSQQQIPTSHLTHPTHGHLVSMSPPSDYLITSPCITQSYRYWRDKMAAWPQVLIKATSDQETDVITSHRHTLAASSVLVSSVISSGVQRHQFWCPAAQSGRLPCQSRDTCCLSSSLVCPIIAVIIVTVIKWAAVQQRYRASHRLLHAARYTTSALNLIIAGMCLVTYPDKTCARDSGRVHHVQIAGGT
ncbi:hypothetical protein BaRGS_00024799, partial [Batillaria attramentaria]